MTGKHYKLLSTFFLCFYLCSCNNLKNQRTEDTISTSSNSSDLETKYPKIPDSQSYYNSPEVKKVVDTLEQRFKADFKTFINDIKIAHAKLYVCYITSETGRSLTVCERKEQPFFEKLCNDENIPFIDFTEVFKNFAPKEITFMPLDGHFNKKGASLIADRLSSIIEENAGYKSDITYPASSRSALLGDQEPAIDKIVEEKKGLPYRLITNDQGLRMTGNVEFPKTKQHLLFMGDSEMFFAGLDNGQSATGLLEKKYPDKDIMNAAKWAYTIDDELFEWQERSKYSEPDIIFLQITGEGITNLFFSYKLKFHRQGSKRDYNPTPIELKYYQDMK